MKRITKCLLLLLCLSTVFVLSSCGKDKTNITNVPVVITNPAQTEQSEEFQAFSSKEEVANYVYNYQGVSNLDTSSLRMGAASLDIDALAPEEANTATGNSGSSSYQTNTQVENVDEADVVKVHGNTICYLSKTKTYSSSVLHLLQEKDGALQEVKSIKFQEEETLVEENDEAKIVHVANYSANDLYLTDRYVIVRIDLSAYDKCTMVIGDKTQTSYANNYRQTAFKFYDINTLEEVKTIATAGDNVSTRLIDNTLYVINNYYNFSIYDFVLPFMIIDDVLYETSANKIIYSPSYTSVYSFVSIYKIELGSQFTITDKHVLTPYVNNIYMNENNIYLIRNWYNGRETQGDYLYSYQTSKVLALRNDNLSVIGSFTTIGNIGDKYWIDEKDNYIRVVTSGTISVSKKYLKDFTFYVKSDRFNYLTIYEIKNNKIEEVSSIREGIGKPGEQIKSARFNGDVVTVVTFVNTDPIYYIDISNPHSPKITSALEVSGYSAYQHPYLDHYVIGFGYEIDNNTTTGYKITMFDTSNQQMKVVGKPFAYSYTNNDSSNPTSVNSRIVAPEFFSNPKALLVNLDRDMFGYHELIYTKNQGYSARYRVFKIDLTKECPFVEILKVESSPINNVTNYINYARETYIRMVFIGNNYYLLSYDNVICYKYENQKLVETNTLLLNQ